jgi:PAS domain S-box-containing protein
MTPRWWRSVRVQLAALMLAVALPISIAHLLQSRKQMAEARSAAEARVEQAAQLMANRTDDWVETANASFLSLADPVRRNWDDRPTLDSLLGVASSASNERFINFFVVDTLGRNRGSGRPTADRDTINFRERDYFGAALRSNGPVVGAPRQSFIAEGRPWVVIMARALRDPDGRAYGVIASPVRIDTLTDFINIASFRQRPLVTLLDTSGVIVARSESPELYIGRNMFASTGRRPAFPDTTIIMNLTGSDSVTRLTASMRSRRAPWLVNVGLPVEEFEAPLRAQQRDDLLMSLAALILAAAGAVFIGGRIARPLVSLASDAQRIADGASDHRAAVVGPSEVQMASAAVNRMAQAAQQRNEALADNEQRYRFLFESNPLPMWAWHADSMEILAVNDAVLEKYGYRREQLVGKPITTLLDPSEFDRFSKRRLPFTEDKQSAGTWKHRTADGRVMEMEIITTSSRRLGAANWLSIGIDVTARKEAEIALARSEEQLRQSQKMEAVGAFAGGIAHDFNNLLTGIVGFSEFAMDQLEPEHPTRADIAEVLTLAERGAELTRQILAVSRKQVLQPTTLDLNAVVTDLERLFARLVGEHITLTTHCDALLGMISADRGQLEQVMLNLVANARDAMPDGGTLTIETQSVNEEEAVRLGLREGKWCVLEVRDTGVGMTDAVRERIFEPFFTTKERGKGTGLGLSLAYAMLAQIGGVITCESRLGQGSTFRLCFPRERFDTGEHRVQKAQNGEMVAGTETILLAEDEASVRQVATATLERAGYLVLAASDGPDALAMSRAYASPIHLLLTDVVMPGMHGRELADVLLAERPETRVLFMSGYTDDAVLLRGIRIEEVPFQQKPFTPRQLAQRVRDVLDAPLVRLPALADSVVTE